MLGQVRLCKESKWGQLRSDQRLIFKKERLIVEIGSQNFWLSWHLSPNSLSTTLLNWRNELLKYL